MFEIPKDRSRLNKASWFFFAAVGISSVFILIFLASRQAFSSDNTNSHFPVAVVINSPLNVTVSGYGKFVPRVQRGINALSGGHIIEVFKKPGSLVAEGEVILSLNNPKLLRLMETSELALLEEQANQRRVEAESAQALEDQRGNIRLAKVKLALADAELVAHRRLKDNQVISTLDLHKAQVAWEQEDAMLQMELSRFQTLQKTRKAIEDSTRYRLEKAIKERELLVSEVEQLNVRASMTGMLTELADGLEIGRHVEEGQAVGMIADLSSYYARINITAADAEYVNPGLLTKVQFKGVEIIGEVSRVDPTVNNGSVELDIGFSVNLPMAVRPNIDVTAKIAIAEYQHTLVVDRPIGVVRAHREYPIFVLDEVNAIFQQRNVTIGDIAGDKMQVLNGVFQGEKILLKVPKHLANSSEILMADLYE
ncbi:efflux RND transporter periplasmic adaptor subunit [Shewanella algidipiscicola]|uniref:efflux RND transporter periplasmic adaptor subunit n=1 Tax=Shewanella algidipiscicola TaxID=614070 RepID=UPI000D783C4A|nr:HlyD family efflux transporter periplasmic adaptor subunit [Shewanella algidipiscicola]